MKQNRFLLLFLLLTTQCNAEQIQQPQEPIILEQFSPTTHNQVDSPEEIILRASILATLAATVYSGTHLSGYADHTVWGATLGDYANSISIGLLWDALKRGYYGNPETNIQTDLISTVALQAVSTAGYAGYHHGCQKLATALKTDESGIIPTCRNSAAYFIEPCEMQQGTWQKSVFGIVGVQGMLWWLKPEEKIETLHKQVEQSLNDLQFKEFVHTLKTTDQKTLYINFPHALFAAAYFTEEGNINLAEQLKNGTVPVENNPLPINVEKARTSTFFGNWIATSEQRLINAEKDVVLQKNILNSALSNFLCSSGILSNQQLLTQKALVYTIQEFLNELRKNLQQTTEEPTQSPFKPLLAKS